MLSGASEPVGAFIGWVALRGVLDRTVFGALFGMVAGMMTFISFHELLPTARRYDPDDKYVTVALLTGMAVMAISLVLFVV
jgi:zinc transporter, ZIP family